ncbi:MAG TPA: adenine phosphoribosyltransferase [Alphaproteobacteria bacterium]|nr:adenine phosphoribosyltransferase [Alphaproteobacteria bacterium]
MDLKDHIRQIPDFPKPGILFYDISTLLAHPQAWKATVERMAKLVAPWRPNVLAGIESRGFLVAAPLALSMGVGFLMVRKKGKLPGKTIPYTYALEYGSDTIEVQEDAVAPGDRVVVLDDLLATGGTMRAAGELLTKLGAEVVGAATIIELTFLNGRTRLTMPFGTLLTYDS